MLGLPVPNPNKPLNTGSFLTLSFSSTYTTVSGVNVALIVACSLWPSWLNVSPAILTIYGFTKSIRVYFILATRYKEMYLNKLCVSALFPR